MKLLSYQSRITEIGDAALRLSELFNSTLEVQSDEFLKTNFEEVKKQAFEMTTAVKGDQAFSKLEKADSERDKAIRVLDKLLKGYEHIPVENLKEHAQKLMGVFKKYGVKITQENYSSQSNLITSMLEDFSQESLKESIEALQGVKEAIEKIKSSQNTFASIRKDYEGALATKKAKASATTLRKPLLDLINKRIIPYLIAMNIAKPEVFKDFVAKASLIVISNNEAVKIRQKLSKKKEKPVDG